MDFKKIFENNQNWVEEKTKDNPDYFKNLSKGQKPEVLYIGCSDSRVAPAEFMGLEPGQVFIHRNIANMVNTLDLNVMSVVNYGVVHLEVSQIVVCGHYFCGGIKAAMQSKDLGILNPWLREVRNVYRLHQSELDNIFDEDKKTNRLAELNVQEQCINLIKTAEVQKAFKERGLKVHGWIFDISTGKIIDLKINFDKILRNIMSIYNIE